MRDRVVGVDLGGTQIRAVLTDFQGRKLARCQRLTRAEEGPEAVMGRVLASIEEVLAGVDIGQVAGIGIGAPGPVDPVTGTLYDPPNLPGWTAISLTAQIEEAFHLPAFAGNDANVAALGEHRFGAGQGVDDLIYLTVSTGIGGGIISGGRLVTGARGFAGEIGHQTLDPNGPLCGCGQPGHLEAFASGPAIAREARQAIQDGAESAMAHMARSIDAITAETVARAAGQGDALACQLLSRAAFYIGLGLTNVIHMLEPARILVGGGVSQAGDLLFGPIRETINQRLLSDVYRGVEIMPAGLGSDVGLLGAVALVLAELEHT
ncbi:MAG: ROK family protein [Chloroflexi bacterium]|nr:MAG: ROK family protein [Chloroflexota bacterium]